MSGAHHAPPEAKRTTRPRFGRDKSGVTAVEFALIAMPFCWLMMGLGENGMIFNTQSNLDYAVMETQREIRTGQVQMANLTQAQLKQRICNRMGAVMGTVAQCSLNLYLDVRAFPDFQSLAAPNLVNGANVDQAATAFNPGQPSEVVLVRALYTWNLLTPVISSPMANLGSQQRLLTSTSLFVNEPYQAP